MAVRVREQIHSNLLGQYVTAGTDTTDRAITTFASPFVSSSGDATSQGIGLIACLVQREPYVLAYIDTLWLVTAIVTDRRVIRCDRGERP